MIKVPEGAQLAIVHTSSKVFYRATSEGVMLWRAGEWVKTTFSSLQNAADLWDEVHTWL